jgi:flavin-binding protein dodecin
LSSCAFGESVGIGPSRTGIFRRNRSTFHDGADHAVGFLLDLILSSENTGRMSEHIYKKIELVGSSPNGFEEAVRNALARAEKTVRNMRWFEVAETRGYIEDGKVGHWQVTLKIGFTLE